MDAGHRSGHRPLERTDVGVPGLFVDAEVLPIREKNKREGLARNACVALGNSGDEGAVSALEGALMDRSPLVREHAAWALGKLGGERARAVLVSRRQVEDDLETLRSIEEALERVKR